MSTVPVFVISLLIAVSAIDGKPSRRIFANLRAPWGLARNPVQAPQKCKKAIDLGIVMDRSLRDTVTGWNDVKQFVKTLVSKFEISDDMTHVGAISFDQIAEVLLKFNEFEGSSNSLKAVYRHMDTWRVGSYADNQNPHTVIDRALELALTNLFTDRDGSRGYDEVLVLLTYGRQSPDIAAHIVRMLEQHRVTVFVVGIGEADPIVLWKIAGALTNPTKGNNVFPMQEPNMVNSVADEVARAVCNAFKSIEI